MFFINPNLIDAAENNDRDYIENFTVNTTKSPGKHPMTWSQIRNLQKRGFSIGAHTLDHYCINDDDTEELEHQIDDMNSSLPTLNSFVLPGGCQAAAQCHVCRTVCRRAERRIISLYAEAFPCQDNDGGEAYQQAATVLCFVNRLSDYFFVLSRKLNIINGTDEKIWQKTCRLEKK